MSFDGKYRNWGLKVNTSIKKKANMFVWYHPRGNSSGVKCFLEAYGAALLPEQ